AWFAALPLDERAAIGRRVLRMYPGRADGDTATAKRMTAWEQGETLGISEMALVTILQIVRGWSDADLLREAGVEDAAAADLRERLTGLRTELAGLIYLPSTIALLTRDGFGTELDAAALRVLPDQALSAAARAERTAQLLATTAAGLYESL